MFSWSTESVWLAVIAWLIVLLVGLDLTMRVVSLIVVPRNRRPSSAMAWLLAIFLIPVFGVLIYLLIGNARLPRPRRVKQETVNRYLSESTYGSELVSDSSTWPFWFDGVVRMNRNLGSMPLVGANRAQLESDYTKSLADITAEIRRAKSFVHAQYYIIAYDPSSADFFDAISEAVQRGVEVRILLDHIASFRVPGYRHTLRRLRETGCEWQVMLPFQPFKGKWQRPDLRNHRKIVVIDDRVGFIGSQNIIDCSYHRRSYLRRGLEWRELVARVEGPIVAGLDAIFATDWFFETGEAPRERVSALAVAAAEIDNSKDFNLDCQLLPSGPGFRNENNLNLFLTLFYAAQERIIISSPYFVPDDAMLYAINSALARGVKVELFVSEVGDQVVVHHAQRSYYEALLRAGLRIFMYRAPYILHAKHVSVDNDVAVIGSSNMDIRSFVLNMEVSLLLRGEPFVLSLRKVEDDYRRNSRELTLEEWLQQPLRSRFLDNIARLTSALQ